MGEVEQKFAADMSPEVRSKEIGGSEAGIIMGFSKWSSPMKLWMLKKGLIEPDDTSIAMRRGKILEPLVADLYREQLNNEVTLLEIDKKIHPANDWMVGHIDRLVKVGEGTPDWGLECKTTNRYNTQDWGEPGTDEVPKHYFIQVMHYMAVTGLPYFDIAVLVGENDFRVYRVHANTGIIEAIIEKEAEFMHWLNNDIQPPIDASESSRKYLLDKYPKHGDTELIIAEDNELMEHIRMLKKASAEIKKLEEAELFAKNKIMEAMAENSKLVCPIGSISWKTNKDSEKVDWKEICSELNVSDALKKKYTEIKPGARVFRPNLK